MSGGVEALSSWLQQCRVVVQEHGHLPQQLGAGVSVVSAPPAPSCPARCVAEAVLSCSHVTFPPQPLRVKVSEQLLAEIGE